MFAAMAKEDDPKRDSTTRPPAMLRLARGLERLHLDGLAFRVYEWRTARGAGDLPTTGEDGLPLPPPGLQVLVSGGAGTGFVEDDQPWLAQQHPGDGQQLLLTRR